MDEPTARAAMERARQIAIAAERGDSVKGDRPCPLPDNKAGFKLYVSGCWQGMNPPYPAGWEEFVAYLDAVKALSAARFRASRST
jgi:hypothetical protein